jgi:hypothetical protein
MRRIKIRKCTGEDYWYKNNIGLEYDVLITTAQRYMIDLLTEDTNVSYYVDKDDCEIVK